MQVSLVKELLSQSDYHRHWDEAAYDQLIYPAIENDHALMLTDRGTPMCFCTWAFLSPEKVSHYVLGTGYVEPEDFEGEDGELWMIDFAAPHGNCRNMVRFVREYMKLRYGSKRPVKIFRPTKKHVGTMYTA